MLYKTEMNFTDNDLTKLSKEQLITLVKNSIKEKNPKPKPQKLLSKQELFESIIESLEKEFTNIEGETIISKLIDTGRFSNVQARKYLNDACKFGFLYEPKPGYFRRV